jgi:hypothetical protein
VIGVGKMRSGLVVEILTNLLLGLTASNTRDRRRKGCFHIESKGEKGIPEQELNSKQELEEMVILRTMTEMMATRGEIMEDLDRGVPLRQEG